MSVRKDERAEGKLALSMLARNHAVYVIQITKNEKVLNQAMLRQNARNCADLSLRVNEAKFRGNQLMSHTKIGVTMPVKEIVIN